MMATTKISNCQSWKIESKPASDWVASKSKDNLGPCCMISVLPSKFSWPRVIQSVMNVELRDHDVVQAEAMLGTCFTQNLFSIQKTHETTADVAVSKLTGPAIEEYFLQRGNGYLKCLRDTAMRTCLKDYCGVGFGSGGSHGDLAFVVGEFRIPIMFVEEKNTSDSPLEQFGQALSEASNGLIVQLKAGVASEDCVVLIVCTNGHLYQFGFATLLGPCFVNGGVISHVLDVSSVGGKREIATLLATYKRFCQMQEDRLKTYVVRDVELDWKLDRLMYFTKNEGDVVLQLERSNPSSWLRYWSIYNMLWSCEELRQHVVFPLGFETSGKGKLVGILFEKLSAEWKLGIPEEESQRRMYLREVRRVLRLVHGVKLVHMDFLPCNIGWRIESDAVKIKLLDFDTACDIGRPIPRILLSYRNEDTRDCIWNADVTVACVEFDAWYCYLLERVPSKFCVTQTIDERDTSQLLDKFRSWIRSELEGLQKDFKSWFEEFQKRD